MALLAAAAAETKKSFRFRLNRNTIHFVPFVLGMKALRGTRRSQLRLGLGKKKLVALNKMDYDISLLTTRISRTNKVTATPTQQRLYLIKNLLSVTQTDYNTFL